MTTRLFRKLGVNQLEIYLYSRLLIHTLNNTIKKWTSQWKDAIENIQHTPKRTMSESNTIYSPSGNWKVTRETTYIRKPISVNTFQDEVDFESTKYISSVDPNLNTSNTAKRQLHYGENTKQITGLEVGNNYITTIRLSSESILTSIRDFQKMFLTFYPHMKHEIQNDHANIMETLFPIKSEEDLEAFEKKINYTCFKASLVSKIGNKDLGNSIRRIMMRLFDDKLLENYSLYGLKKKKSFSNLSCYRLYIDALRTYLKYKHATEKEIDIPLGTWLSHAPFRLKA